MTQSYIGLLESGKRTPSFAVLQKYQQILNASIDWILTGKGNSFLTESKDTPNIPNEYLKMIELITDLPEEFRIELLETIEKQVHLLLKTLKR